jgi:protein tyrosine kinase modulator
MNSFYDNSDGTESSLDVMSYVRMIWERKGIVFLCAVVVICATLIGLTFVRGVYESSAVLLIQDKTSLVRQLDDIAGVQQYGRDEDRKRRDLLVGKITSRPFLERVIRMLKMDEAPALREQARRACEGHPGISVDEMTIRIMVNNLQNRIRVRQAGHSQFRVTVADYEAETAQRLTKWITELFRDLSRQEVLDGIRAAHDFGTEQQQIYLRELRDAEARLSLAQQTNIQQSLIGDLVNGENLIFARSILRGIEEAASGAQGRLSFYSRQLTDETIEDSDLESLLQNPVVDRLTEDLVNAIKRELINRLMGSPAEMTDIRASAEHSLLRRNLYQQAETIGTSAVSDEETATIEMIGGYIFSQIDLQAQRESGTFLRTAISDFSRRAEEGPVQELQIAHLEQEVAAKSELLALFNKQLVSSDVRQAVESTKLGLQTEILDPARMPLRETRPNRQRVILMAILGGPLVGIGLAYLIGMIDPVLRSVTDFSRIMPEPILGSTPLLGPLASDRSGFRRFWVVSTIGIVIILTIAFFLIRGQFIETPEPNGTQPQTTGMESG